MKNKPNNMEDKYDIRFWQDNEWAIYEKDNLGGDYLFKGTLEQVNAWLDLKAKGFDL